jgi:MFS family permease
MDRPASVIKTPGKTAEAYTQLLLGVLAMMSISGAQCTWTLFVSPLQPALGASLAAVQVAFSLFVVLQTFLSPLQGFLVDGLGPRPLLSIGASLMMVSWVVAAHAESLGLLYARYGVLGGLGSGIIYVGVMGLAVSWFPDRRGFAAGVAAAGCGMGAILTTFPIASMIHEDGYRYTLVVFGIAQGLVAWLAAQGLRLPRAAADLNGGVAPKGPMAAQQGWAPIRVMLQSPNFMAIAFGLEAVAVALLLRESHDAAAFIL